MVFRLFFCHRQGIHFVVCELPIRVPCHRRGLTFVDSFGMEASLAGAN